MARTSSTARWQRVQTFSAPGTDPGDRPEPPPPAGQRPEAAAGAGATPIHDALVREWAAAGRTLPGSDREWARLVRFPPPVPGLPDPLLGPPPPRRGWLHADRHPG
jgi:hypothetical protein